MEGWRKKVIEGLVEIPKTQEKIEYKKTVEAKKEYERSEISDEKYKKMVEEKKTKYKEGNQEYEIKREIFFEYLKKQSFIQYKKIKKGVIISMLGKGLRFKNKQEQKEEHVEYARFIFTLEKFITDSRGTRYIKDKINKIIEEMTKIGYCRGKPLDMETFLKMDIEIKASIRGMIEFLADEYNILEHWREDKEWMLAEIMMTSIIPKFLNELTDCDCIVIRTNRADDIDRGVDLIIISSKEGSSPYYIASDITIMKEQYVQSTKKIKFIERNIHKITKIQCGLSFTKEGVLRKEEIPSLAWFYTRIDDSLLNKYMIIINEYTEAVNANNEEEIRKKEEEINKIEEEIFIIFCKSIQNEYQELYKERNKINTKHEKLIDEKTKFTNKRKKIPNDISDELYKINEFTKNLDTALKNADLFVEYINQALTKLNFKKNHENFNIRRGKKEELIL